MKKSDTKQTQTVHIPQTDETVQAKTYTGKELMWRDQEAKTASADEYAQMWENDRL